MISIRTVRDQLFHRDIVFVGVVILYLDIVFLGVVLERLALIVMFRWVPTADRSLVLPTKPRIRAIIDSYHLYSLSTTTSLGQFHRFTLDEERPVFCLFAHFFTRLRTY